MPWIKNLQPTILYQQSDLPYIIQENGVMLCINNFYSNKKIEIYEKYSISFKYNKKQTKSYSSNYVVLNKFPQLIHFDKITNINNLEINTKIEIPKNDEINKICIIKNSRKVLNYNFEDYDYSFIISNENINQDYIPENTIVIPSQSWARICISILDHLTDTKGYCWIKNIPFLEIDFCHFKSYDSLNKVKKFFQLIQFEADIQWIS